MSKSLLLVGMYRNNKTTSIGLHNTINAQMKECKFTEEDRRELEHRYLKYFSEKKFKSIAIKLNASFSTSERSVFEYEKYIVLTDNNYKYVINHYIDIINSIE